MLAVHDVDSKIIEQERIQCICITCKLCYVIYHLWTWGKTSLVWNISVLGCTKAVVNLCVSFKFRVQPGHVVPSPLMLGGLWLICLDLTNLGTDDVLVGRNRFTYNHNITERSIHCIVSCRIILKSLLVFSMLGGTNMKHLSGSRLMLRNHILKEPVKITYERNWNNKTSHKFNIHKIMSIFFETMKVRYSGRAQRLAN